MAWPSVSRLPVRDKGPENASELRAPVPLPTRMPESVVEPVPPLPTPKAVPRFKLLIQAVVAVNKVEVAFPKMLRPEKELLLVSRVEDAAEMVKLPPRPMLVPLSEIVEEVAMMEPLPFVERIAL